MKKMHTIPIGIALTIMAMTSTAHADHSSSEMSVDMHSQPIVATDSTLAPVDCSIQIGMRVGSRGEHVECLQKSLIAAGYLRVSVPTGYFGAQTKEALMKWQKNAGVPATGYFGTLSQAKFAPQKVDDHVKADAHQSVDATNWPSQPKVGIQLHRDAMSGFNVEVKTENFRFAPEHVNGAVIQSEGHAHVMVNGKKFARLYGSWIHIPGEFFAVGDNEVLVTLNANDHSDIVYGGQRVEAKQTVTK